MRRPLIIRFSPLALILLTAAFLSGFDGRKGLQIGDPIPNVTLTDFHGKSMALPQGIKGKVALIRFWEFDCPHCNKELLFSYESLYQKYKDQGFLPLAIHETRPPEGEERFHRFERLSYPMLIDEFRTVAIKFGVIGLPTTFIVDEKGIVREKIIGETGIDTIEKLVTKVLHKRGFYDSYY